MILTFKRYLHTHTLNVFSVHFTGVPRAYPVGCERGANTEDSRASRVLLPVRGRAIPL